MTTDTQKTTGSRNAVLFGILQLLVLAGLLLITLQSDFKGGMMIIVILAGTMSLQTAALISDIVGVKQPTSEPPASTLDSAKSSSTGNAFARIAVMVMALLIICYFIGVYVGFVFFLSAYWWRVARFSPALSLTLALLVGLALPAVFKSLVNITMWPGIIPELIPGYLGGAVPPPF